MVENDIDATGTAPDPDDTSRLMQAIAIRQELGLGWLDLLKLDWTNREAEGTRHGDSQR